MTLPPLRLNPALKASDYAAAYARGAFVQIPDMFEAATAAAIEQVLRTQMAWRLIYVDAEKGVVQLSQADIQALGRDEMVRRMKAATALATRNIGYRYNGYPMVQALAAGEDAGHPIHVLTAFLQSREFLDFGQAVIGHPAITKIDAQATLFTPGSYLTRHIDEGSKNERKAAYTIGFSKNWQTDWGGLLMFIDQATTDVTSAWLPRFNTLTLFNGLRVHAVSPVSGFAGNGRFSVVGWLRDD